MTFVLLSRVLLWLLVGTILYSLFQRFFPSGNYVARLFLVILFVVVVLSFINPREPAVASLWSVISFPLKPLGAAILLMIFAAQRIKSGGGMDAPGGYLIGWALTILLLASTPAFAYFLERSPVARLGEPSIASLDIVQGRLASSTLPNAPTSGTLVALSQENTVADVSMTPYLAQTTVNDIRRRGLRLEDFVPNAEALRQTTRVWDSYLAYISGFLRG